MSQHTQNHSHDHHHEDFDPGSMYTLEWVQDGVRKIQGYISDNVEWVVGDTAKSHRVLDYACGHGTISLALIDLCPNSTFRGIDLHPKQAQRYNDEAEKRFGLEPERMSAVAGDLTSPSPALEDKEWFGFDVAVMSMALHHVADPVQMLVALRKRLRSGGTLILVEWLKDHGSSHHGDDGHSDSHGKSSDAAVEGMIETVGGQMVWAGFDGQYLRRYLENAGFVAESIEVRVPGLKFETPKDMQGGSPDGQNDLVFVKATI